MENSRDYDEFLISKYQLHLFNDGRNYYSYKALGAHIFKKGERSFARFAVWAPNAESVRVVGDFNNWDGSENSMNKYDGVWQAVIENVPEGSIYKYEVHQKGGRIVLKTDPFGFMSEVRPNNASKVVDIENYEWKDKKWMDEGQNKNLLKSPVSIYEAHLGSWERKEDGSFLSYRELSEKLVDYVYSMGYTHIELLPVMEHPLDDSWGYQVTGYFAPTSRYGNPEDFMYFVDTCHKNGIGVILDWVPAHFPKDENGLGRFDGTALYEYGDPRMGEHKEWGTYVFNYNRNEVISFLISSAMFWLEMYHIDGLRVDAVSSMLYLNYGRKDGEWVSNKYGGKENIGAIDFLRKLNENIYKEFPNVLMAAEESTAWPMVSKPLYDGGLGFSNKWDMGWMHDTLDYLSIDPLFRKGSHNKLTFSMMYAFSENFILPLSHDEVVHGKKSLLDKMPGEYGEKFANLRLLYAYMMSHPGKKLIFMGGEFGQFIEWRFYSGLDWNLLSFDMHRKLQDYVKYLNHIYISEKGLWEKDTGWDGFQWINPNDSDRSIISYIRHGEKEEDDVIVVCNFTPVVWEDYIIGVPEKGEYREILNSDDKKFGGLGNINENPVMAEETNWQSYPYSLKIKVPPLSVVYFKHMEDKVSVSNKDLRGLKHE
jgi:alpha-1,4-glucan:alpha-1,4-glucan 6-glycosyltransferase